MEYVFGVLAVWFLGTLPATHIAAGRENEWDTDNYPLNTSDRVIGFVVFWPFVVLKRVVFSVAWAISWPFAKMYRAVWVRAQKRGSTRG